jgi:hypothetical protein
LVAERPETVEALLGRMEAVLEPLEARKDPIRLFLATYRRTTLQVRDMVARDEFADSEWVERWDVAFANLYLDAVEAWEAGQRPPGPWAAAFGVTTEGPRLPPLRHLLLGMNAHINYDLPQSLLAVITDDEFDDDAVVARRAADHAVMDQVLVDRVKPEDEELAKVEEPGDRTWLDRALTPFNRAGTKRFLKESRRKVWHNAKLLSRARRQGPDALAARVAELDRLSEARIADLRVPGQVLLKLSIKGFGVELAEAPPA